MFLFLFMLLCFLEWKIQPEKQKQIYIAVYII